MNTEEQKVAALEKENTQLRQAQLPKRFPIQKGPDVPWEAMAPHESMAQANHYQSFKRLAERGGLCPGEAWCVVSGIKISGAETKEQCDEWEDKWRAWAERINCHYDRLAVLEAKEALQISWAKRCEALEKENAELKESSKILSEYVSTFSLIQLSQICEALRKDPYAEIKPTVSEDHLRMAFKESLMWANNNIIPALDSRAEDLLKLARECYAGPKNPTA